MSPSDVITELNETASPHTLKKERKQNPSKVIGKLVLLMGKEHQAYHGPNCHTFFVHSRRFNRPRLQEVKGNRQFGHESCIMMITFGITNNVIFRSLAPQPPKVLISRVLSPLLVSQHCTDNPPQGPSSLPST